MTQGNKYWVLAAAVLLAGALRLPFEQQLTADLKKEKLLSPRLEIGTGEKLGQTFYAVSLGGLRTLIATFMNIRAYGHFENQKWADVVDTYDLIVDLAPRTKYYWDSGSWHMSNNAASYYIYESNLPPLRRRLLWKSYIVTGRNFLERGIRNNPDDAFLYERLGQLLADPYRIKAFGNPELAYESSYDAYKAALETGTARKYTKRAALYSLAQVPGREKESLELLLEIKSELKVLPPSMSVLHYVLEYHRDPKQPVIELVDKIFPSRQVAYGLLTRIWLRSRDRLPMHGVARAIRLLELELGVAEEKSLLKRPQPAMVNPDDYFRK